MEGLRHLKWDDYTARQSCSVIPFSFRARSLVKVRFSVSRIRSRYDKLVQKIIDGFRARNTDFRGMRK